MKKQLLKLLPALIPGALLLPANALAQCSGGTLDGNITPTTTVQTVTTSGAGTYETFNGVAGATYMFSYCSADGGSASYDTQLTILDDATGSYAGGYNDDWCGLQSYLTWVCPSNAVYRILSSQYYCTTNTITATLAYKIMPPPNDDCVNATYVTVPSTVTGNTTYANADVAPTCVTTDDVGGGVWYVLTGDGNQMTASLCTGTSFDTRLRIFTGSCGSLVCEDGNDDFCSTQSEVTWCSVNGTLYYILVHGNGSANGDFTLTLSENYVQPPNVSPSISSFCGSGTVQLVATGGSGTFNWSPPGGLSATTGDTVMASPAFTTTYTVAVTDPATGCPAYNSAQVIINPYPVISASASATTTCNGDSTTLSATGASTYNWQPGNMTGSSVTVGPNTTTTYTVIGASTAGCTDTASVTVTVNPLPPVTVASSPTAICVGDFATLSAAGANTYQWAPISLTGANVNVAPTTTTTYYVTGTDGNGCMKTDTITLPVNPLPAVSASASPYTICQGSSSVLTATGGGTFLWSDSATTANDTIYPSSTITYSVVATDSNGCSNSDTVHVNVLFAPPVTVTASVPVTCGGGGSVLSASGAQSYTWMPGNLTGTTVTVNPSVTTTYTATGTNPNGCMRSGTATVSVYPAPNLVVTASDSLFCSGTTSTLTATGATSYSWQPGNLNGSSVNVTPSVSTAYVVTATDTNGCNTNDTIMLNVLPSPALNVNATPPVVCTGNSAVLTATGAATYNWQPGNQSGSTITVTPAASMNYTVTGVDTGNGCSDTYIIGLSVAPPPNVIAYAAESNACLNDADVLLTGVPSGGTWSGPGVTGSSFSPSTAGQGSHTLTYSYTDSYGCSNTATATVDVGPCTGIDEQSGLNGVSFYPNPNAGSFTVNVSSSDVHTLQVDIFDLQGRIVYSEMLTGVDAGYSKKIDVTGLANGVYYVKFSSDNASHTDKLIIGK